MIRRVGIRHASRMFNRINAIPCPYVSQNCTFPSIKLSSLIQIPQTSDPYQQQSRLFATQRNRKKNKRKETVLMNEKLVSFLMNRFHSSAREIQVRLVVEEGVNGERKTNANVLSLLDAIQKSSELEVDLIGLNLDQEIPIVKAQAIEKILFREKLKDEKNKNQKSRNTKEYKFKAGIADHDFERKASGIVKYLKKGHNCQIMLTANGMHRKQDPAGVETLLKKLQEDTEVRDAGTVIKTSINKEKSYAKVTLQPLR